MRNFLEVLRKKSSSDKYFYKIMAYILAVFLIVTLCFVIAIILKSYKESGVGYEKFQEVAKQSKVTKVKRLSEIDLLIKKLDKKILEVEEQQKRILKIVEGLEKIEEVNQQNLKIIEKLENLEAEKK